MLCLTGMATVVPCSYVSTAGVLILTSVSANVKRAWSKFDSTTQQLTDRV